MCTLVDRFYENTLLAAWVLLFFFGVYLFVAHVPKEMERHSYARSRRLLGLAMLLFGVQVFLHWVYDFRGNARQIAAALNLSIFYIEGILYGMAFISLLDLSYINRRQVVGDLSHYVANMIVLWCGVLLCDGVLQLGLMIFCAVSFLAYMVRIVRRFFAVYRRAIKDMDNYFSEDVENFVFWLYKCVWGIIVFGLSACILAFSPKWGSALYMFAGIFMFVYIFISFQNYTLHYKEVDEVIADEEETAADEQVLVSDEEVPIIAEQVPVANKQPSLPFADLLDISVDK